VKLKRTLPPMGAKRTLRRFALLPTAMSDGTKVWLEWYAAHYSFHRWYSAGGVWMLQRRTRGTDAVE
jgi:hypothetical protein